MHRTVEHGPFSLSYQVFGTGSEVVVCLHGHGRSSDDFHFLAEQPYRVISIDLFFHGASLFPETRVQRNPVTWSDLSPVFASLFDAEQVDRFHLLAFSQGGRFALKLLETMPLRVQSCSLLAPDGLNNHSFYNRSSRFPLTRSLFRYFQKKPRQLQTLARWGAHLGVIRPKVTDFIFHFTADTERMDRASKTWMAFRQLQPNPTKIGELVRTHRIPFQLIMGRYDQVIRPKQAMLFLKNAGLPLDITLIENGHDFFKASSIEKFKQKLVIWKQH